MTVPPLFDHLDTEDEDQLRHDAAPRDALFEAGSGPGVGDDNPPAGAHPRLWAWLHVEPFYWTMRVVYVCLAAGAVFAVYINGVAEGWWHAWGEKPSIAATAPAIQPAPTASALASGEAAMSGGYQVGPDGVLVRPAQYAADTYTKPELPDEARENTERGAEAAAEHYLALLVYGWNTGDTRPFADMSSPTSEFANGYINDIDERYANGWTYGLESKVTQILALKPLDANGTDTPEGSVLVKYRIESFDGTTCVNKNTRTSSKHYQSTFTLVMTWSDGRWKETQGRIISDNE
ncbi:DUF6318 family protein [Pauljensenia sp. 20925_1_27]